MRNERHEITMHYKMYKSKKMWLFAGIGALMLGWGMQQAPASPVSADPQAPVSEAGPTATPAAEPAATTPAAATDETSASPTADAQPAQPTDTAPANAPTAGTEQTTGAAASEQTGTTGQAGESTATGRSGEEVTAPTPQPAPVPEPEPETPTLTDEVKAKDELNISKTDPLQESYNHRPLTDVSGAGAWQGNSYAAQIAPDAKGTDPATTEAYLDEWMPDYAFQYVLWQSAYQSQFPTIGDFRANFTKADLAGLTELVTDDAAQNAGTQNSAAPTAYYQALTAIYSLEGLQYATNLQRLDMAPNVAVNEAVWGTASKNGNLYDISALTHLAKLQSVTLRMFSINDLTPLANKPVLSNLEMPYNQITDISPLASDPMLDVAHAGLALQHVLLSPITLREGTTSYQTPSFIIKDVTAANLPIKAFDASGDIDYPDLFPSTADGGNIDPQTLNWSNMYPDTASDYGSFSTLWDDPNSGFNGWILQPYALAADVGNVTVNYATLQADAQGNTAQLLIAPTSTLSGKVGDAFDLNTEPVVGQMLQSIAAKGYTFAGVILDGSGKYADYLAGNGLAHALSTTAGNYTDTAQQRTLLFVKGQQATVRVFDDDLTTGADQPIATVSAANDLRLAGAPGTTSTYNDEALLDYYLNNPEAGAKQYRLISDGTKTAEGASAIVFPAQGAAPATYDIHLGHAHKVTSQQTVTETITYTGAPQNPDPHVATKTFITVTDMVDPTVSQQFVTDEPVTGTAAVSAAGQPTGESWQAYDPAAGTAFVAVPHPTITNWHVVSTTQTPADTSEISAVPVTPSSTDFNYQVTYAPEAGAVVDPEDATLTLSFVDVSGQTLQPDKVLQGFIGNGYQVTPPAIAGHVFVQAALPDGAWTRAVPLTGSLEDATQKLVLVYQPLANTTQTGHPYQQQGMVPDTTKATLTVRYVDLAGNALKPADTLQSFIGTGFSVTAPELSGHVYVQAQLPDGQWQRTDPATGTLRQTSGTLTLVYQPLANTTQTGHPYQQAGQVPTPEQATLTVRYVDLTGQPVMAETLLKGFVGNGYAMTPPTVNGHVFVQAQLPSGQFQRTVPVVGTLGKGSQILTLIYQPLNSTPGQVGEPGQPGEPSQPVTPTQPTTPTQPAQPSHPSTETTTGRPTQPVSHPATPQPTPLPAVKRSAARTKLPQTGDASTSWFSLLGLALVGLLASPLAVMRKRH